MRKRTDCSAICSAQNWVSSSHTSEGVYTYTPFKVYDGHRFQHGERYGRSFRYKDGDDRDRQERPIIDEAILRGYCVKHYRRPSLFIDLRLAPRSRRHARQMLASHGEARLFQFLVKLSRERPYVTAVVTADHMDETRRRWLEYVRNPSAGRTNG